jgi:hypothetical protein
MLHFAIFTKDLVREKKSLCFTKIILKNEYNYKQTNKILKYNKIRFEG